MNRIIINDPSVYDVSYDVETNEIFIEFTDWIYQYNIDSGKVIKNTVRDDYIIDLFNYWIEVNKKYFDDVANNINKILTIYEVEDMYDATPKSEGNLD